MTTPNPGREELELRVDIDPRYPNSPVLNRVSGDVYQIFEFRPPLRPPIRSRLYTGSWIIDEPAVTWHRCQVEVAGTVRYYTGAHPVTTVRIEIPWSTFLPAGPATATFASVGSARSFTCKRESDCFRDLALELDVCQSVDLVPTVPTCDTHAHDSRPAGLPRRVLTVEESYREAGVSIGVVPARTVIDDGNAQFSAWSDAELHDAMEQHFSRYPGSWPKWAMWGLLAGRYDAPTVAGIMFDYGTAYGGPGRAPERQGFAVFRQHPWFANLTAQPTTQAEAAAMRAYLYTWIHEAGHAFNFVHSWDKSRPDALSWMNYPQRYDQRNGADSFWRTFTMRFDDEELIHLRHGDRSEVIPGGDAWATGWHLEAPSTAMSQLEGEAPLELLVRSTGSFSLLEPVVVELRLRNLLEGTALAVDPRLDPEFGAVVIQIQRPGGQITEYRPVLCKLAEPRTVVLEGADARDGEDRLSVQVQLTYGRDGFTFESPGLYLVRALYIGLGDIQITSNVHRIYIAPPVGSEENALAPAFFTHQVGMNLYLGGSPSPFLEEGFETLRTLAQHDGVRGARIARTVSRAVAQPFYRVSDTGELVLAHDAEPDRALAISESARGVYRGRDDPDLNIEYHALVRERAVYHLASGEEDDARRELTELHEDLAQRGVNEPVLEAIEAYSEEL